MAAVEPSQNSKDDIDLVDLTATLVRNRRVFCLVFAVVFLVGAAYTLLVPGKYEYTSLLEVANTQIGAERRPLEVPESTVARLLNEWLPMIEADYYAETSSELPFDVSATVPKATMMVQLKSEATTKDAPLVQRIHEKLLKKIGDRQDLFVKNRTRNLKLEISSAEELIEKFEGKPAAGEALVFMLEQKAAFLQELDYLTAPKVIVTARDSIKQVSIRSLILLVIFLILGLILGVFSALFVRFWDSVRRQMDRE